MNDAKVQSIARKRVHKYIKPHFDVNTNEIGFRVGLPILTWEIATQPRHWIEDNDNLKVYAHAFKLTGIDSNGLRIGASVRARRFIAGVQTGETNCDFIFLARLRVSGDHRITVDSPPPMLDRDCAGSGFDLLAIFDYLSEGLSWIVSGGQDSFGLFDILAGYASVVYNLDALLTSEAIAITDPIERAVLSTEAFEYVRRIYQLDDNENQVYLKDIRYDTQGVWFIFSYPEDLENIAEQILDIFPLALVNTGQTDPTEAKQWLVPILFVMMS